MLSRVVKLSGNAWSCQRMFWHDHQKGKRNNIQQVSPSPRYYYYMIFYGQKKSKVNRNIAQNDTQTLLFRTQFECAIIVIFRRVWIGGGGRKCNTASCCFNMLILLISINFFNISFVIHRSISKTLNCTFYMIKSNATMNGNYILMPLCWIKQ